MSGMYQRIRSTKQRTNTDALTDTHLRRGDVSVAATLPANRVAAALVPPAEASADLVGDLGRVHGGASAVAVECHRAARTSSPRCVRPPGRAAR
jgi:hypothetical protein